MHSTWLSFEIFWTPLSERQAGLELRGAAKPDADTFGHESALVARCCSPAKLLGFRKLVGTPRCNDARRCHQCDSITTQWRSATDLHVNEHSAVVAHRALRF